MAARPRASAPGPDADGSDLSDETQRSKYLVAWHVCSIRSADAVCRLSEMRRVKLKMSSIEKEYPISFGKEVWLVCVGACNKCEVLLSIAFCSFGMDNLRERVVTFCYFLRL